MNIGKSASYRTKGSYKNGDLVREEVSGAGWREKVNMTPIKGAKGINVDPVMKMMYAQAKNKAPDA